MSTTVTYKGNTLTTAENQTRVLKTSGKYLEDDVTIVDVTSAAPVLQTKTATYTPSASVQTDTITADVGYDGLDEVDITINAVTPPSLQTKTVTYTPSESQQTDTITADVGYDGLDEVDITVNAISPTYVGSGITRRDGTDLSASGATVTVPSGYYEDTETKSVASGSVTAPSTISGTSATVSTGTNTLTLSKTVAVTPSVTTPGYVSSGTAGNSSVSLTASVNTRSSDDLSVSGDTVTAPAGYYASSASKSVASGTAGTPTATKGAVSNHSVDITPSVTNTTGYITGGTKTGTAVTVTAAELVSGSQTITSNGSGIDVTNLASVDVSVSGGSPNLQTKSVTYTPSESQQTDTIEADVGYDGLDEVDITINAIPYPDGDLMEFGTTGLAGTSWTFNSEISASTNYYDNCNLSFTSNGINYTTIFMQVVPGIGAMIIYDNDEVYEKSLFDSTGWQNQAYRDITITGGTDATNADLIAFIEANATQTS